MMVSSPFRRFAGGAGLAALLILVLAGAAEAACGDCSGHHDRSGQGIEVELTGVGVQASHGHDTPAPTDGHPPCCDMGDGEKGENPDLPVCPHSVAATGCAGAGSLPASPTAPLNDGLPVDLGPPAVTDVPVSAFTTPPFQPPRA